MIKVAVYSAGSAFSTYLRAVSLESLKLLWRKLLACHPRLPQRQPAVGYGGMHPSWDADHQLL